MVYEPLTVTVMQRTLSWDKVGGGRRGRGKGKGGEGGGEGRRGDGRERKKDSTDGV